LSKVILIRFFVMSSEVSKKKDGRRVVCIHCMIVVIGLALYGRIYWNFCVTKLMTCQICEEVGKIIAHWRYCGVSCVVVSFEGNSGKTISSRIINKGILIWGLHFICLVWSSFINLWISLCIVYDHCCWFS